MSRSLRTGLSKDAFSAISAVKLIAMRLEDLNALDAGSVMRELLRCCGSSRWARRMAAARPFASPETMVVVGDKCWGALDQADWLEAFAAHPRIGAGGAGGAGAGETGGAGRAGATGGAGRSWSEQEQAGVADAAEGILLRLADANRDYEARFGYIFIVCAAGKSAAEMLDMLEGRMGNDPETEVHIAANEQRKITRLRLMKLVDRKQDTTE
jgi:OHCU decarboxylase